MPIDAHSQPPRSQNRWIAPLICVALVGLVVAAYWPVGESDFIICDDSLYVTQNPFVKMGLGAQSVRWAFLTVHASNWHPLTWLSHMLDCQLFGLNAARHHQMSVAIHAATTVLLFLAFRQMTGSLWCSALVAALFGVHPLHVESVAWIAERKDVLSGFFFALSLLCYAAYARRPSIVRYLPLLIAYLLGLLAKPMLVTLPFVLLLLDYWPLKRIHIRRYDPTLGARSLKFILLEKLPLLVLAIASSVITWHAQNVGGSISNVQSWPIGLRAENALISYMRYLGLAIWPTNLAIFYPFFRGQLATRGVAISIFFLLAITIMCALSARRRPHLIVGWLWFLGMLIPVIGLIQVGSQSLADRYMYLPMIGLTIMLAWSLAALDDAARRVAAGLAIFAVILWAALTWQQVKYWKNGVVLFDHALKVTPENPFTRNNLASELAARMQFDAALEHLHKAIDNAPNYPRPYITMARVLIILGRYDQAENALKTAHDLKGDDPDISANLGDLAGFRNDPAQAAHYRRSLELSPAQPLAEYNLAIALAQLNDFAGAESHFRRSLWLNPNDAGARYHLAAMLIRRGAIAEAEAQLRQSLGLQPNAPQAIQNLAWILCTRPGASRQQRGEALSLARRADNLSGHADPVIIDTLAAAYAANGDFPSAVEIARRALDRAKSAGDRALAEQVERRLELYRAGSAYVDPSLGSR